MWQASTSLPCFSDLLQIFGIKLISGNDAKFKVIKRKKFKWKSVLKTYEYLDAASEILTLRWFRNQEKLILAASRHDIVISSKLNDSVEGKINMRGVVLISSLSSKVFDCSRYCDVSVRLLLVTELSHWLRVMSPDTEVRIKQPNH